MKSQDLINALVSKDEKVTRQFFFKDCRPLFISIIRNVFSYDVDFDEFVNEFYLYLIENNAYRLRQFEGRSSIYQWMKVVATRYFITKRDRLIENESEEPLIVKASETETVDTERKITARMDVEQLLQLLPSRRYEYVIRRLVLQDADPKTVAKELFTNVDKLYNIKKRAIASLMEVALNEVEEYGKK